MLWQFPKIQFQVFFDKVLRIKTHLGKFSINDKYLLILFFQVDVKIFKSSKNPAFICNFGPSQIINMIMFLILLVVFRYAFPFLELL